MAEPVDVLPPTEWLPGNPVKGLPPRPCPQIMTYDEVAEYLRLDTSDSENRNAKRTLQHYRSQGLLKGFRMGKTTRFHLEDVRELVNNQRRSFPA